MRAKRFINAIGGDPGNCVLVVGSGLSKKGVRKGGAGLPDWDELMKLMILHLDESGRCSKTSINQLQSIMKEDPPRYLDVAEKFFKAHKHDADGYEQFLRQHLAPSDIVDSEVHKLILNVGFRGIVSYNFDMVFEKQSDLLDKVVYPSLLEQIGRFRRKGFFAKIHGCISGPAKQLILTRTSFEQLAANTKYAQLVKTIFLGHVVLCVGFSLRDPDFQSVLSDIKNCWGFDMPPLYALIRNPGEKVSQEWLTKGVDILSYSDHSEIPDFFQKLSTLTATQNITASRSSSVSKSSRPRASIKRVFEKERQATDAETKKLRLLIEEWGKKQKIEEMHSIISSYLKKLPTQVAKEATLFRIAALSLDNQALHLCEHLLAQGTSGCLDLAFKIFCSEAEETTLYQLPPHSLLVQLHRWVLQEKIWEHSSADTVIRWLLSKEWSDHGVDLGATFHEILSNIIKNTKREGLAELYAESEDIPGATEEIEKLVFASDFIRHGNDSNWRDKGIVQDIREKSYRRSLRGRDLSPEELLGIAEAADKNMPDTDSTICVADAVKTLLREFPHCTYLTIHGSSGAYDPMRARTILDALAGLRKIRQQMLVIRKINDWGIFEERGSHSEGESEQLRTGLLIPLWWRYSSEMRVEYLKYHHKGRGPERDRSWTGQDMLLHDLMGLKYDFDEDFRREFNSSLETYRKPEKREKWDNKYEPRLLQELWRERELKYEISEECPPELVRRIVTRRTDWDRSESGDERWDESRRRAIELLEDNQQLHKYASVERTDYVIDNLLGAYYPQRHRVILYDRMIRWVARELSIDKDALSTIVYIHESVHAFCHVGRDLNGRMWDGCPAVITDSPEEQINKPQEAIAQYYTFKLLELLGDDQLFKAFLSLEKVCSSVYRDWRQTEKYSLEQMHSLLIRYRTMSGDWPIG